MMLIFKKQFTRVVKEILLSEDMVKVYPWFGNEILIYKRVYERETIRGDNTGKAICKK